MEAHTLTHSISLHLRASHITADYFATINQIFIHNLGEREQTAAALNKPGFERKQE